MGFCFLTFNNYGVLYRHHCCLSVQRLRAQRALTAAPNLGVYIPLSPSPELPGLTPVRFPLICSFFWGSDIVTFLLFEPTNKTEENKSAVSIPLLGSSNQHMAVNVTWSGGWSRTKPWITWDPRASVREGWRERSLKLVMIKHTRLECTTISSTTSIRPGDTDVRNQHPDVWQF